MKVMSQIFFNVPPFKTHICATVKCFTAATAAAANIEGYGAVVSCVDVVVVAHG